MITSTRSRVRPPELWKGWLLPILAVAAGMGLVVAAVPAWSGMRGPDLQADVVSVRALLDGLDPYGSQADLRSRYGFGPLDPELPVHFNPHFPVALFAALPFALLPFPIGLAAYRVAQVVSFAIAWWWAVRIFWRPSAVAIGAGILVGAWAPFWQGLEWGAPPGFLALTVLAAWRQAAAGREVASGFLAALAAGLRLPGAGVTAGWSTWPRFRIIRAAGVLATTLLISLLLVGTSPLTWLHRAASVENFIEIGASLSSVLRLGASGAVLVALLGLSISWIVGRRLGDLDAATALGLSVAVATFPLGWFHYDCALLMVLIWLVGRSQGRVAPLILGLLFFVLAGIPALAEPGIIFPLLRLISRVALAFGVLLAAGTPQPARSTSPKNLPV